MVNHVAAAPASIISTQKRILVSKCTDRSNSTRGDEIFYIYSLRKVNRQTPGGQAISQQPKNPKRDLYFGRALAEEPLQGSRGKGRNWKYPRHPKLRE
jgi:hypothetical protein